MSQSNLKINSINKETMEVLDQIQILLSHFDTETCQNNLGYIYWSYPLKNTAVHLQSQVLSATCQPTGVSVRAALKAEKRPERENKRVIAVHCFYNLKHISVCRRRRLQLSRNVSTEPTYIHWYRYIWNELYVLTVVPAGGGDRWWNSPAV